eukprot:PhF_6_TR3873/c0_g1_i1/m.5486
MLRRTILRRIGVEGDITMSVCKDKEFIAQRLASIGKGEKSWKPSLLSDEEVLRLAISSSSPENLFNKQNGISKPTFVVDMEHEAKYSPTRYGDWEKNGRCIDF